MTDRFAEACATANLKPQLVRWWLHRLEQPQPEAMSRPVLAITCLIVASLAIHDTPSQPNRKEKTVKWK